MLYQLAHSTARASVRVSMGAMFSPYTTARPINISRSRKSAQGSQTRCCRTFLTVCSLMKFLTSVATSPASSTWTSGLIQSWCGKSRQLICRYHQLISARKVLLTQSRELRFGSHAFYESEKTRNQRSRQVTGKSWRCTRISPQSIHQTAFLMNYAK
jgi:hypothetical protein